MDPAAEAQGKLFISYSSSNVEWVEALARNLEAHGHGVFLDRWSLVGGDNFVSALRAAIDTAEAAVLVATPESFQSGWVEQEYHRLLSRRNRDPTFRLVPVMTGKLPPFDFIEEIHAVEFGQGDAGDYR